jgi:periplasmic mercuric ion binding protein
MKRILFILIAFCTVALIKEVNAQKTVDQVACFRSSMDCDGCETTIFEHLRFEKGVKDLKVDHISNTIKIIYAGKRTNEETLKKSVEKKGYLAEKISLEQYLTLIEEAKKNQVKPESGHQH